MKYVGHASVLSLQCPHRWLEWAALYHLLLVWYFNILFPYLLIKAIREMNEISDKTDGTMHIQIY